MPRRGGRPVKRNRFKGGIQTTGGVRGLAVSIDTTELGMVSVMLSEMRNGFQRTQVRRATRRGLRPVANHMRRELRRYSRGYSRTGRKPEGVGASARAVAIKVISGTKVPGTTLGLVGVRTKYAEQIQLQNPDHRSGVASIRTSKNPGHAMARRGGRASVKKYKNLKNIGPIARKVRLNPRQGRETRKPSKYFHLINSGGRRIRKIGDFIVRASKRWDQHAFNRELTRLVSKAYARGKGMRKSRSAA